MPHRVLVAKELAELLKVLAHPNRIRIVEELRGGERDVNALQSALGISHSGVSQHLMLLRVKHLVSERREGRHVFYHLQNPELAVWIAQGIVFLEEDRVIAERVRKARKKAQAAWAAGDKIN